MPWSLVNEAHHDSLVFSQALWEIREALGQDAIVEQAVLLGAASLLPDASFQEGAAATVASIEALIDTERHSRPRRCSRSTGTAQPTLRASRRSRAGGDPGPPRPRGTQDLAGLTLSPFVPAVVQLRYEVEGEALSIAVRYRLEPLSRPDHLLPGAGSANLALLVSHGSSPVTFATSGPVGADADDFVAADEVDPDATGFRRLLYYRRDGEPLPEGTVHLALVNMGLGSASIRQISIASLPTSPYTPPLPVDGTTTSSHGTSPPTRAASAPRPSTAPAGRSPTCSAYSPDRLVSDEGYGPERK